MSITEKIRLALSDLDIPCYFITRNSNNAPCIVYNYISSPKLFADNIEKSTQYTVLVNIYCLTDIERYKEIITNKMIENGFIKTSMQSTMLDATGFFNTPIQYKICLRSDINE